jgi:nucleotide-binding universal stress UspA family protein
MKIVVGYRKDSVSDDVLKLAASHAKVFNAKVYVVSSLKGGEGEKMDDIDKAESNLTYAVEYLKELGVDSEQKLLVRGMAPGEDIVQFSEENDADEVIVGVVKISKVGKLLMGSTAQYVILHSPCPVISVK